VLTGANTSTREHPPTGAKGEALEARIPLQTSKNEATAGKGDFQLCDFDKLGVTGSSPVPPMLAIGMVEPVRVILAVLCVISVQLFRATGCSPRIQRAA